MIDRVRTVFLALMQQYLTTCIGPSTLRNQGAKNVIRAARQYLGLNLDLTRLSVSNEEEFLRVLDEMTVELVDRFPKPARHWGAARKAINIFLREVCYNRFLAEAYVLKRLEEWLEIPVDKLVAGALRRLDSAKRLPQWQGIKASTPEINQRYQQFAREIAVEKGLSRAALDMHLWLHEREKSFQGQLAPYCEPAAGSRPVKEQ
jgi:hypothetical protein